MGSHQISNLELVHNLSGVSISLVVGESFMKYILYSSFLVSHNLWQVHELSKGKKVFLLVVAAAFMHSYLSVLVLSWKDS